MKPPSTDRQAKKGNKLIMDIKDEILPTLTANQAFVCVNGCGECEAVEYDFCYYESRDKDGNLESKKTHKSHSSNCCGLSLEIWDKSAERYVEWPKTDLGV